ncbi:SpoIID/LytB domain-containing protein [Rhodocaloribacter sp.]
MTCTLNTQEDLLRIRLFEQNRPEAVTVSGASGLLLFIGDEAEPLFRLAPGEEVIVEARKDEMLFTVAGRRIRTRSLRLVPNDGATFTLAVTAGDEPGATRRYEGSLTVAPATGGVLELVNHVPVEAYVASVVASEYGFDDLEGAKAMAVIIRTYALRVLGRFGDDYDHVDHTLSQVYRGADAVTDASRAAARRTRGEVLTYDGALVEAVYFASSGGHTADNETVWKTEPKPYLRGVRDPYDHSPHAKWSVTIPRKKLLDALSKAYGFSVEGIRIAERSRDGRVRTMTLLGDRERTISGNEFRLAVIRTFGARTLKSTLFDARVRGDAYVFEGRGFGHGVGLSQWGAHEMAQKGRSYRDILTFYYTGVAIARDANYAALLGREGRAPSEPPPVTVVSEDPPPTASPRPASETKPAARTKKKRRRRLGW